MEGKRKLASFLLELRQKEGWSLNELERRTGINSSYLNRLEKGERNSPSIKIINTLAHTYNVELMDLVELILRN